LLLLAAGSVARALLPADLAMLDVIYLGTVSAAPSASS
jgi:hypothetical protein